MKQLSHSRDLREPLAKAIAAGLTPVADIYAALHKILESVEAIEAETARLEMARPTSLRFRNAAA